MSHLISVPQSAIPATQLPVAIDYPAALATLKQREEKAGRTPTGSTSHRLVPLSDTQYVEVYTKVFALDIAARHRVQFQMLGSDAVAMQKRERLVFYSLTIPALCFKKITEMSEKALFADQV